MLHSRTYPGAPPKVTIPTFPFGAHAISGSDTRIVCKSSAAIKEQHPTLVDEECLHKLTLVCQMQWKDTSKIEAKHATIRRLLLAASVQTHAPNIQHLSAQWCMNQYKGSQRRRGVQKCLLVFSVPKGTRPAGSMWRRLRKDT